MPSDTPEWAASFIEAFEGTLIPPEDFKALPCDSGGTKEYLAMRKKEKDRDRRKKPR